MKTFKKLLPVFVICWIAIFALTFITAGKDLIMKDRLIYSFALSVIAASVFFIYGGGSVTKTSSKKGSISSDKEVKTFYVFEGAFSKTLVYRIENDRIYRGMSRQFEYEIKGDKICKALSNKWLYRIENNLIYEGSNRTAALYKIENGKIYEGDFSPKVVYRISTSRFG